MTTIPTFNDPVHGLSAKLNTDGIGDAIGAPVQSIATLAELLAYKKAKIGQTYLIGSEPWLIVSAGTLAVGPTVQDMTAMSGQAVSTSLTQDCTFAEDTRTIAFLRSVHGSSDAKIVSYAGRLSILDLAQVGAGSHTTAGGVKLTAKSQDGWHSPLIFGAGGAGITDDSAAVSKAASLGALLLDDGHVFKINSSIAITVAKISIKGGGQLLANTRSVGITLADTVTHVDFRDFTLKSGSGINTTSTSSVLEKVKFKDVEINDCETGIQLSGIVKRGWFLGCDFKNINRTLSSLSCQGIRIGLNIGANSLLTKKVVIDGCIFDGIVNNFSVESHAVLFYGREVVLSNCIGSGVTEPGADACETFYFKAMIATCTGNIVSGQGATKDGMITIKGVEEGDTSSVQSGRFTCTGNTLSAEPSALAQIGIFCQASNSLITGNNLINTYPKIASCHDIQFSNNRIKLERLSGGATYAFELESLYNLFWYDNDVSITVNGFDSDTSAAAIIRSRSSTLPMSNLNFRGGSIEVTYPDMITASNSISVLQIFGDAQTVAGLSFDGVKFKMTAPSAVNQHRRNALFLSGSQNIEFKALRCQFNAEAFWYEANSGDVTAEIRNNTVPELLVTTANKGMEPRSADNLVRNSGATAVRITYLPAAVAGVGFKFRADDPTYGMTVARSGSTDTFTGGTTSKSLSVGSSMEVRCFVTGRWQVVSSAGTIT